MERSFVGAIRSDAATLRKKADKIENVGEPMLLPDVAAQVGAKAIAMRAAANEMVAESEVIAAEVLQRMKTRDANNA
jgi:hypothetical protein